MHIIIISCICTFCFDTNSQSKIHNICLWQRWCKLHYNIYIIWIYFRYLVQYLLKDSTLNRNMVFVYIRLETKNMCTYFMEIYFFNYPKFCHKLDVFSFLSFDIVCFYVTGTFYWTMPDWRLSKFSYF